MVWDLRSPSTPPVRVPTGTAIQGLALSPDGRILYTSTPLTAYDVATGKPIWRREEVHVVLVLDVNAAGNSARARGLDDRRRTRSWWTRRPARRSARCVGTGTGSATSGSRPTVSLVGSVSDDGELIVWDTATGRPLERWDTFDPWGVGFSPDNDLVYGGGGDSMLRTWDLSVQDTYLQQTTQVGDAEEFAHADISPDGQQVAYRWLDDKGTGWVRFVDTVTGEATHPDASCRRSAASVVLRHLASRRAGSTSLVRRDAGCAETGIVTVLDTATGKVLDKRDAVRRRHLRSLAYVDGDRSLLVGRLRPGPHGPSSSTPRPFNPGASPSTSPADCCPPRSGTGAPRWSTSTPATSRPMHWRVIDVSTGEVLSEGDVDLRAYASVASPDGSTVAVAGNTGEIVTIDVSTGDEQRRSTSLGAAVRWLNYSDDGELLVSGAADGGVSLWDASTLDLLGTVYPPHQGEPVPAGAQFIGDTHDVAIASYDGRVYRWETDLERALDFACQMAGRDLTEEEWEQFLPAQPYQSVCPTE